MASILQFGFLLALACAAGAALPRESQAAETVKTITLPAGEFHEECMQLSARQRLDYSFSSAAPVEFNIHYHRDDKVYYPVRRKSVAAMSGSYVPKRSDGYCLMWRNPQRTAVGLDYRFAVIPDK